MGFDTDREGSNLPGLGLEQTGYYAGSDGDICRGGESEPSCTHQCHIVTIAADGDILIRVGPELVAPSKDFWPLKTICLVNGSLQ